MSANPTSVTPGQASILSYDCENITSCSIFGGQFGNYTSVAVTGGRTNGSQSVSPTADTTYVMNCDSGAATASAQVIVTNPGLNETNP
jgi:hypothetical protein